MLMANKDQPLHIMIGHCVGQKPLIINLHLNLHGNYKSGRLAGQ